MQHCVQVESSSTLKRQGKLVFTPKRDRDLDIYTMDGDGKNVKRLTN
jgi:Tol biopolymer transport system component